MDRLIEPRLVVFHTVGEIGLSLILIGLFGTTPPLALE